MAGVSGLHRIFLVFLIGIVSHAAAQCNRLETCDQCTGSLGKELKCVWCLDRTSVRVTSNKDGLPAKNAAGQCASECPVDPNIPADKRGELGIAESSVSITPNTEYTLDAPFAGLNVLAADIKLRRGDSIKFDVKLKKGPVRFQLYFLLDLSDSMSPVVDAVISAAVKLPSAFDDLVAARPAEDIKPLDGQFKFGFGSYVDKPVAPYTFNRNLFPVPTHGFQSKVLLAAGNEHAKTFTETVNSTGGKLSGNSDLPEGGLEALIQSVYCDQQVGWERSGNTGTQSLSVVLMATDELSHVAGDGVEAGIVWPAELKCHTDLFFGNDQGYPSELMNIVDQNQNKCPSNRKDCMYHNVIHDYPSVRQVGQAMEETESTVAFLVPAADDAAKKGVRAQYEEMAKILGNQGVVVDGQSITPGQTLDFQRIARDTYFQVFDLPPVFVALDSDSDSDFNTYYKIGSAAPGEKPSTSCALAADGVQATVPGRADPIELLFDCRFTVSAIKGLSTSQPLKQVQTSLQWGKFTVTVQSSTCTCPSPNYFDGLEIKCNDNGVFDDLFCGECQCEELTKGTYCDCSAEQRFASCPLGGNNRECNDRAEECECGKCKCKEPYTGVECECENVCGEPDETLRCGGSERGECDCNTCKCNPPFSGPQCECNEENCLDEKGLVCGGKGTCKCNKCECDAPYEGEFCSLCNSAEGRFLTPPVLCGNDLLCSSCNRTDQERFDNDPPSNDTWGCNCCFNLKDPEYDEEEGGGSMCQWCPQSSLCFSRDTFDKAVKSGRPLCAKGVDTVKDEKTNTTITKPAYKFLENVTQCPVPEPFDPTGVIIGTVLGILALVLLALLLWRLLTHLKDKKEWENYEKDKANSKWQADSNPIFKSSVAEYENPIFD